MFCIGNYYAKYQANIDVKFQTKSNFLVQKNIQPMKLLDFLAIFDSYRRKGNPWPKSLIKMLTNYVKSQKRFFSRKLSFFDWSSPLRNEKLFVGETSHKGPGKNPKLAVISNLSRDSLLGNQKQ